MVVTLLGIVTLVNVVHLEKTAFPMPVTGQPSSVLGISTAPPEPV
jgi:hypothetical protein